MLRNVQRTNFKQAWQNLRASGERRDTRIDSFAGIVVSSEAQSFCDPDSHRNCNFLVWFGR